MSEKPNISDDAVKDATGKTWDEWFALLDDVDANEMEHADIASALQERDLVDSGW